MILVSSRYNGAFVVRGDGVAVLDGATGMDGDAVVDALRVDDASMNPFCFNDRFMVLM